jgi:hypothetical protein
LALINRLIDEGVTENVARELVHKDAAECEQQLTALPHRYRVKDRGAYLVRALCNCYAMPPKVETKRRQSLTGEQKKRDEEAAQRLRNEYNDLKRKNKAAVVKLDVRNSGNNFR